MSDLIRNRDLIARVERGEGFVNEDGALELAPGTEPERAARALAALAKHIKPGEWNAVLMAQPDLTGVLQNKTKAPE